MRSVTAAAAALDRQIQRHRIDVGEHRPGALVHGDVGARDERERRGDDLVAVADADRAQREVQPGGPARDGARERGPDARRRTPARTRRSSGPSDRRPERSTSSTRSSSAAPSTGCASGMLSSVVSLTNVTTRAGAASPRGSRRPDLHPVLERVDERLPGRLDHVLRDADRAPHLVAVGGVEQHARDRAGPLRLVEDPDLEVDEVDLRQMRMDLDERVAQRPVERVHRTVALGRADVALAVDPDLDRGLGLDAAVGPLLDDRPPRLEPEQRLVVAGLLAQQQLERAVGRLVVIAAVLELLDPLDHAGPRRRRRARCPASRARACTVPLPESSEISTSRRLPTTAGSMCSKVVGSAATPATCIPPLCANALRPTYGWSGSGVKLSSSSRKCAAGGQRPELLVGQALVAELQLQVRDDRDEVRVAAALAVAVHRALHVRRAGRDRGERVRDAAAGVVVAVDPDPHAGPRDDATTDRHRRADRDRAACRRSCRSRRPSRRPRPPPPAGTAARTPSRRRTRRRSARRRRRRACPPRPGTRPTRRSSAGSPRGRP